MIRALYELLTDRPWTTVRSCTAEFGPTPAARYRPELLDYTDAQLYVRPSAEILAEIRRKQAADLAARRERIAR